MKGEIRTVRRVNDRGEFVLVAEYYLGGKKVTKARFDKALPDGTPGKPMMGGTGRNWPIMSKAAGVAPRQVKRAAEIATERGVPTDYLPSGEAVFRSRGHRKAFLKAHGFRDNDGGYGDG